MDCVKGVDKEGCQSGANGESTRGTPIVVKASVFVSVVGHERGLHLIIEENSET